MGNLKVISDKLNIRDSPFADPDFSNWIGDLNKGETITADKIITGREYNGNPYWYKDAYNRYYSLDGLGFEDARISWGSRLLGVPHIWPLTKGEGIKVALIDSGIDLNNSDLNEAVSTEDSFNVLKGNKDVQDKYDQSHGTLCASILASRGNNGLLGVAPAVNLIIIKIAEKFSDYLNPDLQIQGLRQALNSAADIISISFGIRTIDATIQDLIRNIINSGKICIAATGDVYTLPRVLFPANYPGMISVGSVACKDESADIFKESLFTQSRVSTGGMADNENEGVTIVAPGDSVTGYNNKGIRVAGTGTSFSAPYVAGIAALWLARNRQKGIVSSNNHFAFKSFLAAGAFQGFIGFNPQFSGNGLVNPLSILSI